MRSYLTFIMGMVCFIASAQNINDVVRYSTENLQGTARFQAMSGAFGALGGDLSSLNVNPAGSAVFNYSQFTVSGSNYHRDNDALYGNSTRNTDLNAVELNQAGGVFVFKSIGRMTLQLSFQSFDSLFHRVEPVRRGFGKGRTFMQNTLPRRLVDCVIAGTH